MKTVVITGSARGLGLEMAKLFKKNNLNVVICDLDLDKLEIAKQEIEKEKSDSMVECCVCNVTKTKDLINLINYSKDRFGKIDIWINNAGVNQPEKPIWELTEEEISMVLDVDLKGTVIASKLIMEEMTKNHNGAIYNVEGYGSMMQKC